MSTPEEVGLSRAEGQERHWKEGRGNGGAVPPEEHRWKKGQSGNPGGRPKGESVTSALRRLLESEHGGKRLLDLLAERILKEALSGKHAFVKEVLDRTEGTVNQKHEVKVGPRPLQDILAEITDEQLVEMAIRQNRVDLLPVALREKAHRQAQGAQDHG